MNMKFSRFKLILLFNSLLLFLAGCSTTSSNSSGKSFIINKFSIFSKGLSGILKDPTIVYAIMFIAIFMGSFALYKALLRFAFSRTNHFQKKERNIIALMISIISTFGIFTIFRSDEKLFIILFGGTAGLLLVMFIVFFLMFFFYNMAKGIKDKNKWQGGAGFLFIILIGVLLSGYLLIGYTGQVLGQLGCKDVILGPDSSVNQAGMENCLNNPKYPSIFTELYKFVSDIIPIIIILAIIFGLIWFFKKKGDDEDDDEPSGIDKAQKFLGLKKSKEDEEKEKDAKDMKGKLKELERGFKEIVKEFNGQRNILNNINKKVKLEATIQNNNNNNNNGGTQ